MDAHSCFVDRSLTDAARFRTRPGSAEFCSRRARMIAAISSSCFASSGGGTSMWKSAIASASPSNSSGIATPFQWHFEDVDFLPCVICEENEGFPFENMVSILRLCRCGDDDGAALKTHRHSHQSGRCHPQPAEHGMGIRCSIGLARANKHGKSGLFRCPGAGFAIPCCCSDFSVLVYHIFNGSSGNHNQDWHQTAAAG